MFTDRFLVNTEILVFIKKVRELRVTYEAKKKAKGNGGKAWVGWS